MKKLFILVVLLISLVNYISAQAVNLKWMQHAFRWLSAGNFPEYITKTSTQDSILFYTAIELKKHFKYDSVSLPEKIGYREITMFGNAKISEPEQSTNDKDIDVSILSFITRSTTGTIVKFKMQIIAKQHGDLLFKKGIEHELEYFSREGYVMDFKWYSEEEFVQLYTSFVSELLENRSPLPSKIILGSLPKKEQELKKLALENDSLVSGIMPQAEKLILKTNGDFLEGNSFIVSLQNNHSDTITSVIYRDGWDASRPKIDMSHASAEFFHDLTGINFGYQTKSKEIRYGRLYFTNGRVIQLRMEWLELTSKSTNGTTGNSKVISPMVLEAFQEKDMIAYLTYYGRTELRDSIQGKIGDLSVTAAYNSLTKMVEVSENGKLKVIVVLQNLNPLSLLMSNAIISKNKLFVENVSNSISSVSSREPETYAFYHVSGLSEQEITRYLDVALCLFFGIGNKK